MSSEYPPAGPPTPPPGDKTPPPGSVPPAGYPQGGPATAAPMRPEDQRLWATLIHIGGIILGFISPLVGYLVLKDRGEFIREHTKTALNFQITLAIAMVIGYILTFILIGVFVIIAVYVINIIFSIIAAIAANKGEGYVYPKWCAIQLIK